ncbi:MAG: hypothetical protein ACRDNZ_22045, partial [Streptosporangiaceae bacterium]
MRDAARHGRPVLLTVLALGLCAVIGGSAALAATAARAAGERLISFPGGPVIAIPAGAGSDGQPTAQVAAQLKPLGQLHPADLLVVAPASLTPAVTTAIRRLPGVTATEPLDAATIRVNGQLIQMLGVHPDSFRAFAAGPTARSAKLWRSVASGSVALSATMGKLDKLTRDSKVRVAGHSLRILRVGAFGTVGIGGVDAVVSDRVARSLGIPAGNALVISAPAVVLSQLIAGVQAVLPAGAGVTQLVAQAAPGVTGPARLAAAGA